MRQSAQLAAAVLVFLDLGGGLMGWPPLGGSHLAQAGVAFGATFAGHEAWQAIAGLLASARPVRRDVL